MKALITGSGGLIGSECARVLCREGWDVVGIDNDMRAQFFGPEGTTRPVVEELIATLPTIGTCPWIFVTDRRCATCSSMSARISSSTRQPSPRMTRRRRSPMTTLM